MNSTLKQKQLTLDEVLNAAMLKNENNVGREPAKAKPTPTSTVNSASSINKTVKKNSSRVIKKRPTASVTKTSGKQLTIPDMIKPVDRSSLSRTADKNLLSSRNLGVSKQKLPFLGEPRTAEEFEMCISLSSDTGSDALSLVNQATAVNPNNAMLYDPLEVSNKGDDDALDVKPPRVQCTEESEERLTKPMPIFINENDIFDFNTINSDIKQIIGDSYVTKIVKQGLRVMCNNMNSYNKLQNYLHDNQNKIMSHTYQIKQERGFRGVIRHLHKSTPTNWIREQLTKLGFQIRFLDVIRNRFSKEPLHLFEVELEKCDKSTVEAFLRVNKIGNQQVTTEKQLRLNVPQCHRCQSFGHTKNYCLRPYVCVKCAGSHPSTECKKNKEDEAKCANCKGGHAASYRGCTAYKEATKNINRSNQPAYINKQIQPRKATGPLITRKLNVNQNSMANPELGHQMQQPSRNVSYASVAKAQLCNLPLPVQESAQYQKIPEHPLSRGRKENHTEKNIHSPLVRNDSERILANKLDNLIALMATNRNDIEQQFKASIESIGESMKQLTTLIQTLITLISTLTQANKNQNVQTTEQ